jgi:site-specific DNA-methyltransferase (adenine-specific)
MIAWVYGCLSEDTEILTPNGWERYHRNIYKQGVPILVYDIEKDIYKWERPQRWNEYNIHKDTVYRIKSDNTDQIVSRNHNCLVEREGKLVFKKAEQLNLVESMPTLSNDFLELQKTKPKILFKGVQRILQGAGIQEMGEDRCIQSNSRNEKEVCAERREESCLERGSNILSEEGKLWKTQNKICEMSSDIYKYGEKGWLCNGTPIIDGSKNGEMSVENGSSSSHRPQSREQQHRQLNVIQDEYGTQSLRGIRTEKAEVTKEEYTGLIFCPTVSTGAFVARRNGQIFITGNSGFPKSLNIGKAVDKIQGNEREVVEKTPDRWTGKGNTYQYSQQKERYIDVEITKGNSEWEGWGTALKPALEPITMARKPISEKNIAENVLKWGTGGINIDESRVGTTDNLSGGVYSAGEWIKNPNKITGARRKLDKSDYKQPAGRFPANFIHDGSQEVLELFPETGKSKASNRGLQHSGRHGGLGDIGGNLKEGTDTIRGYNDNGGSAARYFYCAKSSKRERTAGLPEGQTSTHPTVKPVRLMEYLVRLVTPKDGVCLDPFMGSGTTGVACVNTGRKFIGIELDENYFEIAKKRVEEKRKEKENQAPTLFSERD